LSLTVVTLTEDESPPIELLNQSGYVAKNDTAIYKFTIDEPSEIQMDLTIKNDVPLDVITTGGKVSQLKYLAAVGLKTVMDIGSLFSTDDNERVPDFFDNALSQKGVFEHFSSPWVKAHAGVYSIIVDNTEAFTPTRGDAPIELKVSQRTIKKSE